MKPALLLTFSLALLLFPASALAFDTFAPASGATNVEVNDHFIWERVSGASKYVLDISKFTQSEDNIPDALRCSGSACNFFPDGFEPSGPANLQGKMSEGSCSGTICDLIDLEKVPPGVEQLTANFSGVCFGTRCTFPFLKLSIGRIEFADSYTWKVTAYNPAGNPIDDSSPAIFSTEQAPVVAPPPGGGPGGGGPPIISPSDLNPISSVTLQELLENVLNFLFSIAVVVLPITILYGGILLLTAGGNPEKISRSRTILLWAVVAFAIILLARGLPAVLRGLL